MKTNYILAILVGVAAGIIKLSMEMMVIDFLVAFGFAFVLSLVAYDLVMDFKDRVMRDRQLQYSLKD